MRLRQIRIAAAEPAVEPHPRLLFADLDGDDAIGSDHARIPAAAWRVRRSRRICARRGGERPRSGAPEYGSAMATAPRFIRNLGFDDVSSPRRAQYPNPRPAAKTGWRRPGTKRPLASV